MRSVAYLFTAAIVAAAAPAFAQDAAPFSGAHVEALAGWDRTQQSGGHDDGVVYGVGAGYDVRQGNMVFGGQLEATDSNARQCAGAGTAALPSVCAKVGRDLYVGGRIGEVIRPGTLLYGTVGYTNAQYKYSGDVGGGAYSLGHQDLNGVRVGAGVEQAIGPRTFVKAEYRYSNYEQGVDRHQVLGGIGVRF